jgi:hypothetical protein
MGVPRHVVVAVAVAVAPGVAGCGDGSGSASGERRGPSTTPAPPGALQQAPGSAAFVAPAAVPRAGTGPADPAAVEVIRRWLAAVRQGEMERAARFWAVPSTFQNAAPVQRLLTRRQVTAVNASLPCGAIALRFGAAGRYTIVRFRLVERRGGACGTGAGGTTSGAIRVTAGRIHEWYRLYDRGEIRPGPEPVDPGPFSA